MIELNNVTKYYDGKAVVKNLHLTINKGELFVLVGSSGSGKTTTLKMLNRLIEADEGKITIDSVDIKDYPIRELRLNTGYVLQQIALFPNLTVQENIELIPEMKKWKKAERVAQAKKLLDIVGLKPDEYLCRYPSELSGGEQQRVGILRAIIAKPKILLMDEPFSALDPLSRKQLQSLIKSLHKTLEMTVIFVTHDMKEAQLLGERIGVMNQGELIQVDTPKALRENPKNQFIKDFFK